MVKPYFGQGWMRRIYKTMITAEMLIDLLEQKRAQSPRAKEAFHMKPSIEHGVQIFTEANHFRDGSNVEITVHRTPKDLPQNVPPNMLPHKHDFYEIAYVYQGEFINEFPDGNKLVATDGHLILMNPYAAHLPYTVHREDIVFNILLRKSYVEQILVNLLSGNKLFLNFFLDSIYGHHQENNYMIFANNLEIQDLLFSLILENCEQKLYYEQVVDSYFVALFAILSRLHQTEIEHNIQKYVQNRTLTDVISYIKLNYSDVTLDKVAEAFHYSTGYLSRWIKRKTGSSFSDLVSQYRLEVAKRYLQNSMLPIEKITEIIGYSDTSYFYKFFKKQLGISPQEYRKQTVENQYH
ncbi:AraC family transcriptional regulator [Massilioclostridium coli]|nr:AraC family transcriptional regulator [Massilioclostridium coli]PWM99972.1 MAG: AraC family transcriptional regulator [Massilioclostridium sp.]